MSTLSPKYFYTADGWDESDWLDIVSVEYEALVSAYPFDTKFREIVEGGRLNVLDVGCGSALFPRYLEPTLGDGIHLTCDLLDVSDRSLQIRRGVFWRERITVPRNRIQHTDVSQGPLERQFGLATLLVHTAGTEFARVSLPGLENGRALAIRDHLMALGEDHAL